MQGALLGPFGRYELGNDVVTLGRLPANTIVIDDGKTSGRHAEVWPEGAGYVLADVGSTNGTLLNGQPLRVHAPRPLRDGDVITIGLTRVTVELAATSGSAPTEYLSSSTSASYPPTDRLASSAAGFAPTQRVGSAQLPGYDASANYAPPPPPPLPYVLPPTPKKRSTRKWVLLGIGGGLAFLVVACTCVGILLYTAYMHSPEGVTNQYYTDIKSQDYIAAYGLLGTVVQGALTLEAQQNHLASGPQLYSFLFSCIDSQLGPVTAFSTNKRGEGNGAAAVDVSVTRSKEHYTDPVKLVQESQGWKVTFFSPPPNQQCIKTSVGAGTGA